MPPQPETLPNMPSNPALQTEDRTTCFGQSEVSPPALHIALPVISQLVAGLTAARPPHLPDLRFESFDTLRRYSDPPLAIQSKAEELTFLNPPRTALGGAHLKSQMLPDPALQREQCPFRRGLGADINFPVVRIAADRVPPPFQFFIQCIQIDVGQQRRH